MPHHSPPNHHGGNKHHHHHGPPPQSHHHQPPSHHNQHHNHNQHHHNQQHHPHSHTHPHPQHGGGGGHHHPMNHNHPNLNHHQRNGPLSHSQQQHLNSPPHILVPKGNNDRGGIQSQSDLIMISSHSPTLSSPSVTYSQPNPNSDLNDGSHECHRFDDQKYNLNVEEMTKICEILGQKHEVHDKVKTRNCDFSVKR